MWGLTDQHCGPGKPINLILINEYRRYCLAVIVGRTINSDGRVDPVYWFFSRCHKARLALDFFWRGRKLRSTPS